MKITCQFLVFIFLSNFSFAGNNVNGDNIEKKNISSELKLDHSAITMISTPNNSLLFYQITNPDKKYNTLYYTEYDNKTGIWSKPQIIDFDFNKLKNKESKSVLIKKKEIFITKKGKDLYSIKYINNKWQSPKKLNSKIKAKGNISTACISPDGNTLYFSSNRKGTYGGMDIFACDRLSNGGWSTPYNLGKDINTEKDEVSPFMLQDNSTLYFSSQGHQSIGGFDVFYATRSDEGFWDQIDHLPNSINTTGDDLYFIMNDDEIHAYYSSNGNSSDKKLNIYRLLLK